jgi:hypothetical protein
MLSNGDSVARRGEDGAQPSGIEAFLSTVVPFYDVLTRSTVYAEQFLGED